MFLQLIIALVSAVVFSGFYAGYTTPDTPVYYIHGITMIAFIAANLVTVVLGQVFTGNSSSTNTSKAASKPKAKAEQASGAQSDGPREVGSVKWFNVSKGFGFITRDNEEDIFVHYRSIRGQGRRRLFEGQSVEFAVIDSDKGLQADDVVVLS